MARKQYREWTLDQPYLLPPSPRDWLDSDHPVYRVLEVVEELDISDITEEIASKDARGTRPYHPRMLLCLLIYAYSEGVYSSRRIARAGVDRVSFRALTGNQTPHFTVINEFRKKHLHALPGLFAQVVVLCRELGLIDFEHFSIDGTKMQANASKHKAMSYARMQEELKKVEGEIRSLLERAEAEDAAEDAEYGEGRDVDEVAEELKRREDRVARIREAMAGLEEEAKRARANQLRDRAEALEAKAETESNPAEKKRKLTRAAKNRDEASRLDPDGDQPTDDDPEELPHHRQPTTKDGAPKGRAQRNFTDSDSRIMKRDGAYIQGYNAQIVVDSKGQVIVAVGVSNQAPDHEYLIPMLERTKAAGSPERLSADAGYMSADNAEHCKREGIDAYISTRRQRRGKKAEREAGKASNSLAWKEMQEKLETEEGRREYAKRKILPEPVFGQIRGARGFQRFSLRGLSKVEGEWTLIALCHNILKIVSHLGAASSGSASGACNPAPLGPRGAIPVAA